MLHVAEGLGWTPAVANRKAVADVILPLQTIDGNFGKPGSLKLDDVRIPSGNAFALSRLDGRVCRHARRPFSRIGPAAGALFRGDCARNGRRPPRASYTSSMGIVSTVW